MALSTSWRALRPDLLAVVAVVNWGLSYGLTKVALAEWRPLAFTATRFLAMALIAVTVLAVQGRVPAVAGPDRGRFLLGGVLGFTIYQLGFVLGLDRTSALSSTLLLATIPLFSLFFLRLGGIERVRSRQWAGVALAIVGVGILVLAKGEGPRLADARLGDALSLAAAASFALYGIVTRPLGDRYPASTVLAGSLLIGSLPLIPLGLVESPSQRWDAITPSGWAIWLYSVVVPVYLSYTWWTSALAARGVAAIAPYVLLVPLVGGAIAVVGLGEPLSPRLAAGAVLILLGLALGRDWLPRLTQQPR
ncbi:MAG: DMT family transporter [Candidatus Rokuibacteriota bacterium]